MIDCFVLFSFSCFAPDDGSRLFQLWKYPALGGYDCRWMGKGVIIPEEQGSLSIWVASDVGQG